MELEEAYAHVPSETLLREIWDREISGHVLHAIQSLYEVCMFSVGLGLS